jgi:hypothetical protein
MAREKSARTVLAAVGILSLLSLVSREALAGELRGGASEDEVGVEGILGEDGSEQSPFAGEGVVAPHQAGSALGGLPTVLAEDLPEDELQEPHGDDLADLTLWNFFTEGWASPWSHRHRKTPNMALLRVTTNFLEREFRADYQGTRHIDHNAKLESTDLFNSLIAYGLNRRLMIEVIANYQWNHNDRTKVVDGPGAALLARAQLVDTEPTSIAIQMRASAPNKSIGQTAPTMSPSLAGWQDLDATVGLDRVGLYYSLTWDNVAGRHAHGSRTNDLGYDVSLAKTWTAATTPVLANFTTFLEAFATTDLNGTTAHHTAVSLTPGVRFWFLRDQSLTLGVDVPVSQPHPNSEVFRITYILNF